MGDTIQERISRKLFLISSAPELCLWAGLWTKPKLVSNEEDNSIEIVLGLLLKSIKSTVQRSVHQRAQQTSITYSKSQFISTGELSV